MAKFRIILFMGLGVIILSSCATVSPTSKGSDLVAEVPSWNSTGTIVQTQTGEVLDVIENPSTVQVKGNETNVFPAWVMYTIAGTKIRDITPSGVSTRGGISISYLQPGTVWADVGSYKAQINGTFGVSQNMGATWKLGVLPGVSKPTPNSVAAVSSSEAYFLIGINRNRSIWVTENGGKSFKEYLTAESIDNLLPRDCTVNSITFEDSTLFMGTQCISATNFIVVSVKVNQSNQSLVVTNLASSIRKSIKTSIVEYNNNNPTAIGIAESSSGVMVYLLFLKGQQLLRSESFNLKGYSYKLDQYPSMSLNDGYFNILVNPPKSNKLDLVTIANGQVRLRPLSFVDSVKGEVADAVFESATDTYLNESSTKAMYLGVSDQSGLNWSQISLPNPFTPLIIANS